MGAVGEIMLGFLRLDAPGGVGQESSRYEALDVGNSDRAARPPPAAQGLERAPTRACSVDDSLAEKLTFPRRTRGARVSECDQNNSMRAQHISGTQLFSERNYGSAELARNVEA